MAIDLLSLNVAELTTLERPQAKPVASKLDPEKLREKMKQALSEGKDIIQLSKEAGTYRGSVPISEIKANPNPRQNTCNYSVEAFFRKDMPKITTDGGYMVGGVLFSKETLEQSRMVLKAAADGIDCGIGKNTNIDYRNYAQMGIAVSAVKSFAAKNLTEQQAAVVNQAMKEYNEALINMEQDSMSGDNYVDSPYAGLSEYYGKAVVFSEGELNALNQLKKEIAKISGQPYEPSKSGAMSVAWSATNRELIDKITDIFSNMDGANASQVSSGMAKYKEWLEPAYRASGMDDGRGSLAKLLNEDVAGFRRQMAVMQAAVGYRAADYSV